MAPRPIILDTASPHSFTSRSSNEHMNGVPKLAIAGLVIALMSSIVMVATVIWYANKRGSIVKRPASINTVDDEHFNTLHKDVQSDKVAEIVRTLRYGARGNKEKKSPCTSYTLSMIPETAITNISPQTPQATYTAIAPLVTEDMVGSTGDQKQSDAEDGKYWDANSISNLRCMLEKDESPSIQIPSPTLKRSAREQPLRIATSWPVKSHEKRVASHVRPRSADIAARSVAGGPTDSTAITRSDSLTRMKTLSVITDLDWMQYDQPTVQWWPKS